MSVLVAHGFCVSKRNEKREFTNSQGQPDSLDIINVYLADVKGEGDPVQVQVTKEQINAFEPYQPYSLPIEVNVYLDKKNRPVTAFRCLKSYVVLKVSGQSGPK